MTVDNSLEKLLFDVEECCGRARWPPRVVDLPTAARTRLRPVERVERRKRMERPVRPTRRLRPATTDACYPRRRARQSRFP
jgi:hypothetical protein